MRPFTSTIRRRYSVDDQALERYPQLPFEVPAGASSFEVTLGFDRSRGVIDLGCEGPEGVFPQRWRGWSGGARDSFVITEGAATPGYLPGVGPGTWQVVLGLHQLAPPSDPRQPFERRPDPVEVTLEIRVPATRAPETDALSDLTTTPRASSRRLPALDGLTWFAGDLHAHTTHSDGTQSIDQLAAAAAGRGLDFLAVTDHNTTSHFAHLREASSRHGIALLAGQEVTTHRGHANAFGDIGWVDFRRPAPEWVQQVAADGGLLSINHAIDADCAWQHPLGVSPPLLEFWHSSWFGNQTATGPWAFWRTWRDRARAMAAPDPILIGGSDFHRPDDGYPPGTPTTWVAATEASPEAIVEGLAAGRVMISRFPGPGEPVMVRLHDEVVVVDGDGCLVVDETGQARVIHGDRVTIGTEPGTVLRLEAADRTMLAVC